MRRTNLSVLAAAICLLCPPVAAQSDLEFDWIAADFDIGDDSGILARDGRCNDPRFTGPGMGIALSDHEGADASDCERDLEREVVFPAWMEPDYVVAFGNNEGAFAFDGECDDPRFGGFLGSHRLQDALDCYLAFEAGDVQLLGESGPSQGDYLIEFEEGFRGVRIFFATNREVQQQPLVLTSDRSNELSLGSTVVSVPLNHRRGIVERPWEIRLFGFHLRFGGEDPRQHFTIHQIALHDESDFLSAVAASANRASEFQREAFVFVHGYNTTFEDAAYRTAQLVYDVDFDGVPILYSWPSAGNEAFYVGDRDASEYSAEHMDQFVRMLLNDGNLDQVNVICHSMGCNTAIRAMDQLQQELASDTFARNENGLPLGVSEIVLAAPDIDRSVFRQIADGLFAMGTSLTLYASGHDNVLGVSSALASSQPRVGYIAPQSDPYVVEGMETIDITALGTNPFGFEHSDHSDEPVILNDIALLLLHGTRPPSNRTRFRAHADANGNTYWRY